jgi:hypothetical protein
VKIRLLKDVPDVGVRGQVLNTVPSIYRILIKRGLGEDATTPPKRPAAAAPVIDIEHLELPAEVELDRADIIEAIEQLDPEFEVGSKGTKRLRKHLEALQNG